MGKSKKLNYLAWCAGAIFLAILSETIYIEWVLDNTSRKFIEKLEPVKKGFMLESAVILHDAPRLYRRKNAYDDLNELILSLLYINSDVDSLRWGVSSAIKLINSGLRQYPENSDEYLFLLQKKISIANRSPIYIEGFKNLQPDINNLIKLFGNKRDVHQEAYLFIENMLYAANIFDMKSTLEKQNRPEVINKINMLYTKAVNILRKNSPNEDLNIVKFNYYHGYARCLLGDEDGGKDMLASVNKLSKESASFHEAMFINWDWPFIGNLLSPKSSGHIACGKYAKEIQFFMKTSFY